MKTIMVLSATLLLATGCTASYKSFSTDAQSTVRPLDSAGSVYVAVPADGSYGSKEYGGSGRLVASTLARELSKKAAGVDVGERVENRSVAFESARKVGARYTVVPVVVQWEQRATEWSGRPSRMAVDIAVYETGSEKRISSRSIVARSRIASFTSTSPESLLAKPLRDYVAILYGGSEPPQETAE
ncbi:DUF4823 domain-containing protein [Cupriavidus basilensis]|uniref:DUF4823 domain-containing protein n=1 Tax=Cupriavidus basilensis TaxID=68895 RepID=UPI0009E321DE|nr:DUF4823 domain-containing protein [Cupriavidus basilensis]